MRKILTRNCIVCEKVFEKPISCSVKEWKSKRKTCSTKCGNLSRHGKPAWNSGKKLHYEVWNRGMKGIQTAWNKGNSEYAKKLGFGKWMTGKKHTTETLEKMSKSAKAVIARGEHNFYIDGRTPMNRALRRSYHYRLWREAVFKRDNFTCQECGDRGVYLHAHHIKPFSLFPDSRFAIDNGQTLCVPCHEKTPTYKGKMLNYNV